MRVIESTEAAQAHVRGRETKSVLVPTMGALHRGHLELIRVAREHAGVDGEVVVSIFVNPLQFEPGADFEKYPRPEAADEEICAEAGVDLLFRPAPTKCILTIVPSRRRELTLSERSAAQSRPGHFRGVCTVVAKLISHARARLRRFSARRIFSNSRSFDEWCAT